jgi:hypothetical protein
VENLSDKNPKKKKKPKNSRVKVNENQEKMCKINRTIELDTSEGLKSLVIQKPKPEKRK